MKPKNLSLIAVLICAGMTLTMFQNCSKVAVSDSGAIQMDKANGVASATDAQGVVIPVTVGSATDVVPDSDSGGQTQPGTTPAPVPAPSDDHQTSGGTVTPPAPAPAPAPGSSGDDGQQTADDSDPSAPASGPVVADGGQNTPAVQPDADPSDLQAACGLDLKTIHNIVDLAQFAGQDVNLDLLKGKTLVYSSDPSVELKSLNIDAAVGRTILCGCKVDKLNVKKGRLEVYHSEIREIGSRSGKLIHDDASILPAGI